MTRSAPLRRWPAKLYAYRIGLTIIRSYLPRRAPVLKNRGSSCSGIMYSWCCARPCPCCSECVRADDSVLVRCMYLEINESRSQHSRISCSPLSLLQYPDVNWIPDNPISSESASENSPYQHLISGTNPDPIRLFSGETMWPKAVKRSPLHQ